MWPRPTRYRSTHQEWVPRAPGARSTNECVGARARAKVCRWGYTGQTTGACRVGERAVGATQSVVEACIAHVGACIAQVGAGIAQVGAGIAQVGACIAQGGAGIAQVGACIAQVSVVGCGSWSVVTPPSRQKIRL